MNAYWITPKGDILGVSDRHITEIIAAPETFGFTRGQIMTIYRKYREPIGTEGNAREEILIRLMSRGWIRVRYIARQDLYTVQLSDVHYRGGSWHSLVALWAKWAVRKGGLMETSAVNILDMGGGSLFPEKQLYEIAGGALDERVRHGTFAAYLNPRRKRRVK